MGILTQDAAILGVRQRRQGVTTTERQAIVDSAAHIFALGDAQYTMWQKLRCVVTHWDAIGEMLRRPGPQAAVLLLSTLRVEDLR
jgi:hypothetical protein